MRSSLQFTALAMLAAAVLAVGCASHTHPRATACATIPPTPDQLVGLWSGTHSGDLYFCRLDLRPDFTGYFAEVSPEGSSLHEYGVDVYRITNWSLKNRKLSIRLQPATTNAEGIYLVGDYDTPLELEIGGTNGGWKRKVTLHRKSDWDASDRETETAIRRVEEK
jgi:hypothetical protein